MARRLWIRPRVVLHNEIYPDSSEATVRVSYRAFWLALAAGEEQVVLLHQRRQEEDMRQTGRRASSEPGWLPPQPQKRAVMRRLWCRSRPLRSGSLEQGSDDEEDLPLAQDAVYRVKLGLHRVQNDATVSLETIENANVESDLEVIVPGARDAWMGRLAIRSHCLALKAANDGDVTLLRVAARHWQGTHHIVLSLAAIPAMIFLNRSPFNFYLSPADDSTSSREVIYIAAGARVEWTPNRVPFECFSRSSDGDAAESQSAPATPLSESSSSFAYKRSTFPSCPARIFAFSLQCLLGTKASYTSHVAVSSEGGDFLVEVSMPAALEPQESLRGDSTASTSERPTPLSLRLTSMACAGRCILMFQDASTATACHDVPAPFPRDPLTADCVPNGRHADLRLVVQVDKLDVQLLDDRPMQRLRSPDASEDDSPSEEPKIFLSPILFSRATQLRLQYANTRQKDTAGEACSPGRIVRGVREMSFSLTSMQIDSLIRDCEFPVILCTLPRLEDHLSFKIVEAFVDQTIIGKGRPSSFLQDLEIAMPAFHLAIEGSLLDALRPTIDGLLQLKSNHNLKDPSVGFQWSEGHKARLLLIESAAVTSVKPPSIQSLVGTQPVYFERVMIGALSIVLHARLVVSDATALPCFAFRESSKRPSHPIIGTLTM